MSGNEPYTEQELLQRIAEDDEVAFGLLYELYRQKVYFKAFHILQSITAAEDVLQEIFIKIWINRDKLRGMHYFPAWLNTLLRNHLYNKLRQQAHQAAYLDYFLQEDVKSYADQTFNDVEIRELEGLVKRAVRQLPPQQRKVFTLSRMDGFKHAEIAEQLKISPETVKKHLMEALRQIRLYLGQHGKIVPMLWLLLLIRV